MGKIKELTLKHKGYKFLGTATLELWGGGSGTVQITPFILQADKLTHTNIKRSINDGGFGCQRILTAKLDIYDMYGNGYTVYNRTIHLTTKQCKEAFRGVLY